MTEEIEVMQVETQKRQYSPYQGVTYETPGFHLLFDCLLSKFRPWFRWLLVFRWKMSRPFQVRILPKCFPLVPGIKSICYITIGQVVLALPIAVLIVLGYVWSFSSPGVNSSGTIAAFAIMGSFFTANKSNSPLSFFLGIPFERMIPYHNMCSLAAIVLGVFHTYVAYVHDGDSGDESDELEADSQDRERRLSADSAYAEYGPNPDLFKFLFDGWTNLSGTIIIICMIILVSTSFFSILRRWFFEPWLVTHILSTIGVIVFSIVHGSNTIFIVAVWWIVDLCLRYILMTMCVYPQEATLKLLTPEIVEVRFPKPDKFQYNPGQFVQISFPKIAATQFHPITISSAPHEPEVTLHIRALGAWSKRLVKLAEKNTRTSILLEGPYGNLSMDLDDDERYQLVLLISGGIGVTPCQSIAKYLLHAHEQGRKLETLYFAWAARSLDMARSIPPPIAPENASAVVSAHVYITRSNGKNEDDQESAMNTPYQLHEGRPKLESIFQELKLEAEEKSLHHVAVVVCGPNSMLEQVRAACRSYSDSSRVVFDLHEELFEL